MKYRDDGGGTTKDLIKLIAVFCVMLIIITIIVMVEFCKAL